MDALNVELLYKGIISLGVAVAIFLLKDFKSDFKKLTIKLGDVSESLRELITKDNHKSEAIAEIKEHIAAHNKIIGNIKIKVALLEQQHHKPKE